MGSAKQHFKGAAAPPASPESPRTAYCPAPRPVACRSVTPRTPRCPPATTRQYCRPPGSRTGLPAPDQRQSRPAPARPNSPECVGVRPESDANTRADRRQRQAVDQLSKLPIGTLRLDRDLLQGPGEFLRRHLRQRHGTPRAFRNPSTRRTYQGRIRSGTPRWARRSRYSVRTQYPDRPSCRGGFKTRPLRPDITSEGDTGPSWGGAVLAAGVGDGGHHVAVVSVLDGIQSSSVVARSSLVH